jgi:hypothetical protein
MSEAPILFFQLLLDAFQVLDQEVLAGELVVVPEVVDTLMVLQAQTIKMVGHPLFVCPYEIKVLL